MAPLLGAGTNSSVALGLFITHHLLKVQLEEENKKMQRFKQEAEMKRKKKTEEQKKMIEEYHAKKRDVMRELEEYV